MSNLELKGLKGLHEIDSLLRDIRHDTAQWVAIKLPLTKLRSGKYQPRTEYDASALQDLVISIQAQGILQPLLVRELSKNQYEIIAGERRFRAATLAGLTEVPVVVHNVSDETALACALIENIQREALNPMDEAQALVRLKDEFMMTHEQIAERIGRSRSTVSNLIRLLLLHPVIKDWLRTGKLEMGHARALLALGNDLQLRIGQTIIAKDLSVRATERLVQKLKTTAEVPLDVTFNTYVEQSKEWAQVLSTKLSSKVNIHLNPQGKGKVIIHVQNPQEIEWLIKNFTPDGDKS